MKKIFITLALVLLATSSMAEADPPSPCYDLQRATDEARARAHARALERQEQTILQPVPSIADTSCIDSYTLGIDVSKYDPASIASMLKRQAERRA